MKLSRIVHQNDSPDFVKSLALVAKVRGGERGGNQFCSKLSLQLTTQVS
jgi:hypothetical protein